MHKFLLCIIPVFLCTGCIFSRPEPVLSEIGLSKERGALIAPINELRFQERFNVTDHEIVSVVRFDHVSNGTTVQATWFSPDDRAIPFAQNAILIASGAKIARFGIASEDDWKPAPYMLDIRAWNGESEPRMTASGQVHFFIGMNDEEVDAYWKSVPERQRP